MAGQLKEVRARIKSVISTQQITKAMKMVSAAKLRRAQDRIIQMRPYSNKLSEILSNIVSASEGEAGLSFSTEREINRVLFVVMTSDRGLCGAFNTNVNKAALQKIKTTYSSLKETQITVLCIGKKSAQFFKKHPYSVQENYIDLISDLRFDRAAHLAEEIIQQFSEKTYDAIHLVYGKFKNAATQEFTVEPFLPIQKIENQQEKKINTDFIFEPNQKEMLETLIPKILKIQLFKGLLDTNASEHGARMTAMDKATENANEMLKNLRVSYNRARQAAITTELSEIVAGAAALKGN